MYLYVEMWNVKPSWIALSHAEREQFMGKVAAAAAGLPAIGADVVGAWVNVADTDRRLDKTYFTVFKFPSKGSAQAFEQIVRDSGWYDYFEQTNSSGPIDTFGNVMAHAMTL
jgi:hypothetical protein